MHLVAARPGFGFGLAYFSRKVPRRVLFSPCSPACWHKQQTPSAAICHHNLPPPFPGHITPANGKPRLFLGTIPTCQPPPAHTTPTHLFQALSQKTGPDQNQICKPFLCYKTCYISSAHSFSLLLPEFL